MYFYAFSMLAAIIVMFGSLLATSINPSLGSVVLFFFSTAIGYISASMLTREDI